jgi:hypothetical protein
MLMKCLRRSRFEVFAKKPFPANRLPQPPPINFAPIPTLNVGQCLERSMTRRKLEVELIGDIQPDQIYRTTLSSIIFGYGPQATRDKIRNGDLPMPFPLSPTSRFEAWTGRQIIEHRAQMQALAAEKVKAIADNKRPRPQPRALRKMKRRPAE